MRLPTLAFIAAALALPMAAAAQDTATLVVTRAGARPARPAPAANFTGTARVLPLFEATAGTRATGAAVAFEAGARTAWHTHPRGQTLVVTEGVGRVQRWGAPADEIRTGDAVWIPPGVKHWHGAGPTTAMTHIAIAEPLDGPAVQWMEQVSDAQYRAPARTAGAAPVTGSAAAGGSAAGASAGPSRAQQIMGDIAPKLAQLTDSVLFGDVWARPGLSPRDRSLATVSALIALNRTDQLRSHLALALTNGVTREELVETITHMAFYTGWPNAISAVGVARQVFTEARR